ncbi:MAG: chitobiase/beta-hexosaminidase C-terminal domain-containing protein, partial [Candidatus Acidiferrum sp.]
VDLHSGHVLNVQLSYDGTNLTMTITDPTVNSAFTHTWPINIPGTVGGNSAYAGFTGGTGGQTAVQDVLNWTFSSSATSGTTATPVIIPGSGTFASTQSVVITDGTAGAAMYYTLNGSQPTTSSTKYTAAFSVPVTTTVKAIAVANGSTSGTATSSITIQPSGSTAAINFGSGFTASGLQLNGDAVINGNRLQLTDTSTNFEDSSAFWTQKVDIQNFTNDFNFQITNPFADGLTFTIQGVGTTALGGAGGQLGYGPVATGTPGIAKSVAVKFDIYNNGGEGTNSTGLYINGADPIGASTTLGGGVSLQSGHIFAVHMTYNGTILTMTITDTVNPSQTFTTSWPVNITSAVGATSAYVGFTGATGGSVATQQIVTWSFASGKPPLVFQTTGLTTSSSGPAIRLFSYPGFPDGSGTILDATNVGDNIVFTVAVPAAGTYDVKVSYKQFTTRGIMQTAVNGTNLGAPVDQFIAAGDAYAISDLGNLNFASAGNYLFKFTAVGKNAGSSGYTLSFDTITLAPQ